MSAVPSLQDTPVAGGTDEAARLFADLHAGHPRALSRALTWAESGHPRAHALMSAICREAPVTPITHGTGVGGAGKSTLVPLIARQFARDGMRVGILAVDPSSPFSGGALLGDRIRDTGEAQPSVFFRSVATRGGSGALAGCVNDLVRVMGAAGFGIVVVETVGAGQSEVAVMELAHSVVLVCAPGLGDEVQAIKAGVMEVANLVVVNKCDLPGADATAQTLRQALALPVNAQHLKEGRNDAPGARARWHPPVLLTNGMKGDGVAGLADRLHAHRQMLRDNGDDVARDRRRDRWRAQQLFVQLVVERADAASRTEWPALEQRMAEHSLDPWTAARHAADAVAPVAHQNAPETP